MWELDAIGLLVRSFDERGDPLAISANGLFSERLRLRSQDLAAPMIFPDHSTPDGVRFIDLPPGTYLLSGPSNELVPEDQRGYLSDWSTPLWNLREKRQVVIGDELVTIDVRLTRLAEICGVLIPDDRDPFSRQQYRIDLWGDESRRIDSALLKVGMGFCFPALFPGDYSMSVQLDGVELGLEGDRVPVHLGLGGVQNLELHVP